MHKSLSKFETMISVRMDNPTLQALDALCQSQDRSRAYLIRQMIRDNALNPTKPKNRKKV